MIRILDGPAEGRVLMLRSAPDFLRLVQSRGGQWDGLDQWNDTPLASETIHVYRRVTRVETVHIQTVPRSGSGFFPIAAYRHVDVDGEQFRDAATWSKFMRETPFPPPTEDPAT